MKERWVETRYVLFFLRQYRGPCRMAEGVDSLADRRPIIYNAELGTVI